MEIINAPLGLILRTIYHIIGNYGWSLILFTIIVKALLFPLSIKQQKSMAGMSAIQPKLAELQKKYKYDSEKLNQETMKLYQQHKINPMGGCLPLLIQFPILIGLYNIIQRPLTYILQYSNDTVNQIITLLTDAGLNGGTAFHIRSQIPIANALFSHPEVVQGAMPDLVIHPIDFNFFGFDLSAVPQLWPVSILTIIPILAGLTTFLSSWLTNRMNGTNSSQSQEGAAGAMKMMTYFFPFMTAFFALSLPAGMGFYWILSNVLQLAQQVILHKRYSQKPENEIKEPYRIREAKKKAKKKT